MTTVNLEHWRFELGGSSSMLRGTPLYQAPTIFSLARHVDLLRYLADNDEHDSVIQGALPNRMIGSRRLHARTFADARVQGSASSVTPAPRITCR
jgi:hypothetical protein